MERARESQGKPGTPDREPHPLLAYYWVKVREGSGGVRAFVVAARDAREAASLVRRYGSAESVEPRTAPKGMSGLPRIVSALPSRQPPPRRAKSADRHGQALDAGEPEEGAAPRTVGLVASPAEELRLPPSIGGLKGAGCDSLVIADGLEGPLGREAVSETLMSLRAGDTLVTPCLDALGCSLRELAEILQACTARQVRLRSLAEGLDTREDCGKAFARIVQRLAEMDRKVQSNRTRAGLSAAGRHGRKGGRPPRLRESEIATARRLLQAPGASIRKVAAEIGVSRSTLYRALTGPSSNDGEAPEAEARPPGE